MNLQIPMINKRNVAHHVPIGEVSRDLGLLTLADRRFSADVVLLSKILNGKIDCPDMLSQILFSHSLHRPVR
ncbi:hypothetical protein J6590_080536 [Homalodisca vitripennis]|nr:hypothetical protein J6590_080536 [Homalodisca vitripennis]